MMNAWQPGGEESGFWSCVALNRSGLSYSLRLLQMAGSFLPQDGLVDQSTGPHVFPSGNISVDLALLVG
jgi:hypothetical protein